MRSEDTMRALHAYLDGELDATAILELETRMAADPSLRATYERLRDISAAVRTQAEYHRAPEHLRPGPARVRRAALLAPAFAAVAAVAFTAGLFVARPGGDDDALAREAVAAHVRANLSGRLVDVASSDQHTVKPWFSARLPFSPGTTDLSPAGFELAGGRLDYLGGEPAAVMVYKRRQHVIDVYVGRGEAALRSLTRDGFNVEQFSAAGLRYYVVSDLNRNELADFVGLLRKSGS
jgi:anti-sigma factor RsiW